MDNEYEYTDDSKLKELGSTGGFSVPPHYFTQLRNHVLEQTTGSQIQESSVPEGYFEHSRLAILQKTIGNNAQPNLSVWYKRTWVKYAAAILICSMSVGFWVTLQPKASQNTATLSDEEILNYLEKTDMRDVPMSEVSFASMGVSGVTEEETYIINQTDEQTLLEEL